jgi:hypothetical protein
MQFVCPYCGPIDWNNKYSYSYSYTTHIRAKCIKSQFCHFSFVSFSNFYSSFSNRKREIGENAKISIFAVVVFFCIHIYIKNIYKYNVVYYMSCSFRLIWITHYTDWIVWKRTDYCFHQVSWRLFSPFFPPIKVRYVFVCTLYNFLTVWDLTPIILLPSPYDKGVSAKTDIV